MSVEETGKADARLAFTSQAAHAPKPTGAAPWFTGSFVWAGHADHRPYFQWEIRVAGGTAKADGMRARVSTLGPARQVLSQGPWKEWGSIDAGGSLDVDYRANCAAFQAYQVELAWSGGTETFICGDKASVPIPLGAVADRDCVVAVNANAETDTSKSSVVTWTNWNIGGKSASAVRQILHFKDESGAEVKTVTVEASGAFAPGTIKDCQETVANLPAFAAVTVSTEPLGPPSLATLAPLASSERSPRTEPDGGQRAPVAVPKPGTGLPAPVTDSGLTFTAQKVESTSTGLLVTGTLANRTGHDITGLRVVLRVSDSAKRTQDVVWKAPFLGAAADGRLSVACGLADLGAVAMTWKTASTAH